MSRTVKVTSFCKVCYDNDKPEKEFRSHNVRNEKGKVCCPMLLSVVCTYCGIKGHGPKYCTRLAKDKMKEADKSRTKKPITKPVPKLVKKSVTISAIHSKFSTLEFSSDSDSEPEEQVQNVVASNAVASNVVASKITTASTKSKLAPWASTNTQPAKTMWTELFDSDDEEDI